MVNIAALMNIEEIGDIKLSFKFGAMAANLLKTNVELWRHCAEQAKFLR
jgi:hypothetical protein